ncbi:GNAT family N-acetyltransferase [Ruminiclostridium herbifermentans]|uniref:GNAT family N-acetyltransferase n=1 Tax=Ruminiclostridium herbifermentans TaxID=2488810 RepID=A0A4U7JIH9_9FIRM|nr:GNAT family N-acetyltransferase [Ruminiclostridium herbifermentans]QNU65415.1 GNAT family N-acetyltransferase [Ruminiclostridium herbifermentans]
MKHMGSKTIETDRLILRKFNLGDANNMFTNWANDDEVTKYLTWPAHKSVEESEKIIGMWIKDYDSQNFYQWCIELKQTGEAIGGISVVNIKEDIRSVEVGYCIGRKYWGQGITSEAFGALITFFFEEVQVNRIEARHDINNPNSGRVMEKCGLIKEGVQKQGLKNNNGINDSVIYGLVRDDWKQN